jgi:hypothetical protein
MPNTTLDPRSHDDRCPSCGAALPANSLAGLCLDCATQESALAPSTGAIALAPPTADLGASLTSGFRAVLAEIGPTLDRFPAVLLRNTDPGEAPGQIMRPPSSAFAASPERPERYELFGEIGRGGMGAIIRGRDIDLGRELALKVLLESHKSKPELITRFVEEAQIGGQLQHPGVVPVYDVGTFADRRPFFTMKLVKGETLAEMLRARSTPASELPRFLSIFESVCQTMAYAHARGVIHRDLKPSNVMVSLTSGSASASPSKGSSPRWSANTGRHSDLNPAVPGRNAELARHYSAKGRSTKPSPNFASFFASSPMIPTGTRPWLTRLPSLPIVRGAIMTRRWLTLGEPLRQDPPTSTRSALWRSPSTAQATGPNHSPPPSGR